MAVFLDFVTILLYQGLPYYNFEFEILIKVSLDQLIHCEVFYILYLQNRLISL